MQVGGASSNLSMRIDHPSLMPEKREMGAKPSEEEAKKAASEADASQNFDKKEDPVKKAAERQEIAQLQARDTQVRAHEAAHLAAAGGIAAGGASFTYQRGPDGKMYAVGGEVPISVQGGDDPKETIAKMRQVAAAAMAPADPSPQDYAVAANARSEEMRAMQELRKEQTEAQKEQAVKAYGETDASSDTRKSDASLDISA
ncbi:putative metalloprotease CJM1_0395 family protein [Hydrogenimonas sp.]